MNARLLEKFNYISSFGYCFIHHRTVHYATDPWDLQRVGDSACRRHPGFSGSATAQFKAAAIIPLIKRGGKQSSSTKKRVVMPDKQDRSLITTGFHLPYNPKLVRRAREMRKNPTEAEKKLWYGFLRTFEHRVLRQRPIDNYIVDFYCPQLKLVIEIDGSSHYTEEGVQNDQARTSILEGYGLKVMRFTNAEVLNNFEAVCAAIEGIPPTPLGKGG